MVKKYSRNLALISLTAFMAAFTGLPADSVAQGQADDDIRQQIESMEQQIQELKRRLDENEQAARAAAKKAEEAADQAKTAARQADAAVREAKGPDSTAAKWHLAGYADAGFTVSDGDGHDSFGAGHFNPSLHFQYKDFLFFEGELEFETESDGETALELEYSQIDLILNDYATFVVGKFLSPIGQFQERLHPSWINRLADAPAGFGHGGAQPLSDVGVQLRGGIPVGNTAVTYAVAVGNGPRLAHHGPELEGFGGDDNKNKAVGGRIAFLPFPWLEAGASYLTANITGEPEEHEGEEHEEGEEAEAPPLGKYRLKGLDAAFTKGPWDIRFEYLNSRLAGLNSEHDEDEEEGHEEGEEDHDEGEEGPDPNPDAKWRAWYAQAAFRLSGVTDNQILGKFEPVIRFGEYTIKDGHGVIESRERRFNIGLNYWLAPSAVLRTVVELRKFRDPDIKDETLLQFQAAYGF